MDLRKLEIFCCVARNRSFTAAANTLHMAQPAVSIAVRKLEEELGVVLLLRQGRNIRLTEEGREALARAEALLEQVQELEESLQTGSQVLRGELNVYCPSMFASYFLPELLGEFLGVYPGLTADITQLGTQKIKAMLLADEIELGVIIADEKDLALEQIPLVNEHMVVCMSAQHPWRNKRFIPVELLDKSPMILYESGYFIRETLTQLCHQAGVEPDIRMQTNFLPLITRMVKQSLGTTVGLSMISRDQGDLIGIPLKPRTEVRLAIAKRRGRSISRANQAFWAWLEARA